MDREMGHLYTEAITFFWLQDKPSHDPASSPEHPLETQFTLSSDPISHLVEVALSVFTAGRSADMVASVIRPKSNLHVTTATGSAYLN